MSALRQVGSYHRLVGASIDRAWEYVRDWEHLPWLHRSSFRSIELIEHSRRGWRARIGLHPRDQIVLELVIDGDRYVSRTLDGPGAGSEIWTELGAHSETRTSVHVRFEQPGLESASDEQVSRIGEAYRTLYAQLWDEDESMMIERAAALDRQSDEHPFRIDLGAPDALQLPLEIDAGGRRLRLLEHEGELTVHTRTCPHWLGPLQPTADSQRLECPWHGYAFDISSGRSCDGRGLRLPEAPQILTDPETGHVLLVGR